MTCVNRRIGLSGRAWGLVMVAYGLLLAGLALAPMDSSALTPRFLVDISPDVQNLMHAPCFGLLALIGLRTFRVSGRKHRGLVFVGVGLGTTLFSGILEAGQAFVPGRYGSLTDVLFNVAGIAAALALWPLLPFSRTAP